MREATTPQGANDVMAMLLADARLPVGGHTQSGTLEGALAGGLDSRDVPAYLRARLLGAARVEAGTAVVARATVLHGGRLSDVEEAWAARTASPALREAARTQGRALLMLTERLWPGALPPLASIVRPGRCTVLGAIAAHLGVDARALARVVLYDDVQTVCAAALKLVPLDPFEVTGWVADALPDVERITQDLAVLTIAGQIPATVAPRIEAWAQAHAATTRRLFRA